MAELDGKTIGDGYNIATCLIDRAPGFRGRKCAETAIVWPASESL